MTTKARRRVSSRQTIDLGPPERWARGELVLSGNGVAHGRVRSVIDDMPERCRIAAAEIARLWEIARFQGYTLSRFESESRSGSITAATASERASDARRRLHRLAEQLGPLQWSAIWFLLGFEESQEAWAHRARAQGYVVRRGDVRGVLLGALDAAATSLGFVSQ